MTCGQGTRGILWPPCHRSWLGWRFRCCYDNGIGIEYTVEELET